MSAPAGKYSAARAPGREHVPLFPKGFIAVRIVQFVLCLVIIALTAYGLAVSYAANGIVFILAIALMTMIASIYHLVAEFGAPNLYNYWAVISLDILLVIMWLCAFALLASAVAIWAAYTGSSYYIGYTLYYTSGYSRVWLGALAGAAAVGAMEFILHIISLSIVSVMVHRHRRAGLHCQPGAQRTVPGQGPPGAPVMVPVAAPAPAAMMATSEKIPQTYPQQVYPVQQQQQLPVYPPHQTMTPPPAAPMYPPQQTMTPPPGQPYAPPQQQPTPYYPQQQPLVSQQTGGSYVQHPPQAYPAAPYQMPPQVQQ